EENFIEIRYEEFIKDPLAHVKLIYDELDLIGYEES
ncbi:unnamed protein product, partial [marine sediment metagenome]